MKEVVYLLEAVITATAIAITDIALLFVLQDLIWVEGAFQISHRILVKHLAMMLSVATEYIRELHICVQSKLGLLTYSVTTGDLVVLHTHAAIWTHHSYALDCHRGIAFH